MLHKDNVMNLRDVFCGDGAQHEAVVASAAHFLTQRRESGIFVVGGTNLTGKTSLIRKIGTTEGFAECYSFEGDRNPPPERCWVRQPIEFNNPQYTAPRIITTGDLYEDGLILEALDRGIKTIFLPEIWAGHKQALELIRDELIRKHRCKVVIDAVSSDRGKGFFDDKANNAFIEEQVRAVFQPHELQLHLLDFNRDILREGVLLLAREYPRDSFRTRTTIFPRDQRELLYDALCQRRLDSELASMLDLPLGTGIERK